ncbi:hypothetical protein VNN41_09845 [Lactococcus garvieae]|uniref:hypothetical protein n=1 Tax=Lactococcus garvieae TaxID=1363 RepID=UPI00325104CB
MNDTRTNKKEERETKFYMIMTVILSNLGLLLLALRAVDVEFLWLFLSMLIFNDLGIALLSVYIYYFHCQKRIGEELNEET